MEASTLKDKTQDETKFAPIEPAKYGYRYASFGGLRVIMDKNGLINLTALCLLLGNPNKPYSRWSSFIGSQEDIEKYKEWFLKNGNTDLTKFMCKITKTKGIAPACCTGTYGISDIAIDVARWLSFDFKLATNKIIKDFFEAERLAEIRRLSGENTSLLDKIDKMQVTMDKISNQNDELITQNKRLEQYAIEEIKKHNETHITLEEVRADCREALQVVHKTAPRTVGPEPVPEREEYIRVWKLTGQVLEKYPFDYVCCRVQYKNLKAAFKRLKSRHGELEEIDTIGPIPNSVHDYSCFSQYEGVTMRSVYMNVEGGDAVLRAIIEEVKESELMYATTP